MPASDLAALVVSEIMLAQLKRSFRREQAAMKDAGQRDIPEPIEVTDTI